MRSSDDDPALADRRLAVTAAALYLVNLMLAPGLAFVAIALLRHRHRDARTRPLGTSHLRFAFGASLVAGVLLAGGCLAILGIGGARSATTWVVTILWFTCVHASLILLGIRSLVRALAGQPATTATATATGTRDVRPRG